MVLNCWTSVTVSYVKAGFPVILVLGNLRWGIGVEGGGAERAVAPNYFPYKKKILKTWGNYCRNCNIFKGVSFCQFISFSLELIDCKLHEMYLLII